MLVLHPPEDARNAASSYMPLIASHSATTVPIQPGLGDNAHASHGAPASVELEVVVQSLSLDKSIRTAKFWALFTGVGCGLGSSIALINNLGQVREGFRV